MKYFTKEWYGLAQRMHYTSGVTVIPDKIYSDKEIQTFYDSDLAEMIEDDRRIYNTPPDYSWADCLLEPDNFTPDSFLFENVETGELFHPETPEIARQYIELERKQREEAFANRPPFDPAETIECFEECYRGILRAMSYPAPRYPVYPDWVRETVDKRLLALYRMPETVFNRLQKEVDENTQAFDVIMNEAWAVLKAQNIPEEIKSKFHFHDSHVLALKKSGKDVELYIHKANGTTPPYIKIVFKNVTKLEREKGLVLRPKRESNGELFSNCSYWYDELYKTKDGYELHILLCATGTLRYLTIGCEHIYFVDIDEINLSSI